MARDQLVKKIRDWVGVSCGVKITGTNSAEIYAPKGVVSTLIGKGGENIRDLQDELGGMKLSVSSFAEMPDDVHVPVEDHYETLERRARSPEAWSIPSAAESRKREKIAKNRNHLIFHQFSEDGLMKARHSGVFMAQSPDGTGTAPVRITIPQHRLLVALE